MLLLKRIFVYVDVRSLLKLFVKLDTSPYIDFRAHSLEIFTYLLEDACPNPILIAECLFGGFAKYCWKCTAYRIHPSFYAYERDISRAVQRNTSVQRAISTHYGHVGMYKRVGRYDARGKLTFCVAHFWRCRVVKGPPDSVYVIDILQNMSGLGRDLAPLVTRLVEESPDEFLTVIENLVHRNHLFPYITDAPKGFVKGYLKKYIDYIYRRTLVDAHYAFTLLMSISFTCVYMVGDIIRLNGDLILSLVDGYRKTLAMDLSDRSLVFALGNIIHEKNIVACQNFLHKIMQDSGQKRIHMCTGVK